MRQIAGQQGKVGRTAAVERAAATVDVGDIAVIEDDGSIITEAKAFNLRGRSFRFEPVGTSEYRVVSTSTPFDARGGSPIILQDDDSFLANLGFGFTFYGRAFNNVYLNSDGNLTFGEADTASTDRDLGRFFSGPPRIGPFFSDLDPSKSGTVSLRNDSDGTTFIWDAVAEFVESGPARSLNSFSVKLFKNGNIEFVFDARVDSTDAIVGISPGSSTGGFTAIDFATGLPSANLGGTVAEVFRSQDVLSETALAKKFYLNHPDAFDHLTVFLGFDYDLGGNAYAYELPVKNDIRGIGLGLGDYSSFYGSNGKLSSFLNMGSLSGVGRYPDDPNRIFLGTNSTMGIMGQEAGHRWLVFTPFRDGTTNSVSILGRDRAHWSFFFNSNASVMEGNEIKDYGSDQGNMRFTTVGATSTYSMLDRYIMGLVGKNEVPSSFVVENPFGTLRTPSSSPAVGVSFGGNRKDVTVDAIIAANGPRIPSVLQAQKVFRQAFILLTRKGQTATPEQIQKVQRIRDTWVTFFNEQTGKQGWVVTDLQTTPGTTPSKIFFPYFRGNSKRFTGIAVANWGSTPADVLFQSLNNNGDLTSVPANIINPRMITIPPRAQVALLAEQIHGLSLDDPRDGWIKADSSSSQVTGFFLDGDVDQTSLDGAVAGAQTSSSLFFLRAQAGSGIIGGSNLQNLIDVVNPNATAAQLTFKLQDELGAEKATASRTLPPQGRLAEDITRLFPGIAQAQARGYVSLASDVGVVGYQSLEAGSTVFALAAQAASNATRLYSAQFASGGIGGVQYFTDLNLINTSAQGRTVQLLLVGNNGSPIAGIKNPVTVTLAAGAQLRERGEAVFGLPDAATSATLIEGSLVVTADGPGIIGEVTFGDPRDTRFLASLPLDGSPATNLVLSHVAQGSAGGGNPYFTGVAMYNPNSTDINVTLDVYSEQGVKTGSATIPLRSVNRISNTLPQLVPAINEQVGGYIRITASGGPAVVFELFGDQALNFLAAVPPQPITSGSFAR